MPQEQMPERIYVIPTNDPPDRVQYWADERDIWQNGVPFVPASRLSALAERVERAEALLKEVLNAEHCPDCPDQGWYYSSRGYGQEPDQAQCEWCERTENSLFKVKCRISSFLHDGTKGEGK